MNIDKDKVSLYFTSIGMVIGELDNDYISDTIKLNYPMFLVQTQGGVNIVNIFMKEKWMELNISGLIKVPVDELIKEGYIQQVQKIHSSIILPNDNIKKVIV